MEYSIESHIKSNQAFLQQITHKFNDLKLLILIIDPINIDLKMNKDLEVNNAI